MRALLRLAASRGNCLIVTLDSSVDSGPGVPARTVAFIEALVVVWVWVPLWCRMRRDPCSFVRYL